jgi:threonine/homoserine/homoserine lactone efflux protein
MIPFEIASVFFIASVLLALAPGPDNIFVLTQSALHGKGAGLLITIGLCTGLLVHTTAVSLGVAAVFKTSSLAFNLLKAVGAMYLLYLAWQSFRAGTAAIPKDEISSLSQLQLYVRGLIMNVTNPKVAIFFLAFLPQFADPARGSLTLQIFLLGALFLLAALIVFGSIALGAGFLGEWLRKYRRVQVIMNRVAGTVFIVLALKLLSTAH